MWAHTQERLKNITPDKALQYLKEGNLRFRKNLLTNKNLLQQVNQTSDGQFPYAVILSCIDSRTSAELIFDQGLGDIFSIRIAGNVVNEDILGSMEYACKVAHSRLILVLGHTKCSAIINACDDTELGHFTSLLIKINPAIKKETETLTDRNGQNLTFVNNVSVNNIKLVIKELRARSKILSELEAKKKIMIVGGLYDVETGEVNFYQ